MDKLHAMADALIKWETIDYIQINDIMDGRPPRPPEESGGTGVESEEAAKQSTSSSSSDSKIGGPAGPDPAS